MNTDFHIFIVEDDSDIMEILEDNLKREGYKTTSLNDGADAVDAIVKALPDLVILDLNLPGMSGFEICKYTRGNESTSDLPIIMLTARGEEIDKIIGFEAGADDYVTKPFSPRELLARVKVLLKRSKRTEYDIFQQDNLKINFATHQVFVKSKNIELTPIQFKLLKSLIKVSGKALSRQHLLDTIWGDDYVGDPRTVDVHITRLRDKVDKKNKLILTVKGVGYRWNNQ